MSLLDSLRSGVAVANKVTKPLQTTVQFLFCIGNDKYGPTYALPVPLLAILDEKQQQVRTREGVLAPSRATLTFLDVAAVRAATPGIGRIRPIDRITLADGSNAAIMAVGGYSDPSTLAPVATTVWIG